MTFRGHVRNGVVVPDEPLMLPEGAEVRVEVVASACEIRSEQTLPTLFEQLKDVIGKAQGLPSDLAAQHDHYLHGLLKR